MKWGDGVEVMVWFFYEYWICKMGYLEDIVSDRGV